jgi:protocatechuate 3,4-dioxygenase alpha subunit
MIRTASQTVGPFYSIGLCRRDATVLDKKGVELTGQLFDGQDEPIGDGMIEIWDRAGRKWGRSGTDAEGRFSFRVARDATQVEAFVFARGLLRHQLTRIYLRDAPEDADPTLVARHEGGVLRFDIRMQGERATLFFDH